MNRESRITQKLSLPTLLWAYVKSLEAEGIEVLHAGIEGSLGVIELGDTPHTPQDVFYKGPGRA
jgi:hypothetical protein